VILARQLLREHRHVQRPAEPDELIHEQVKRLLEPLPDGGLVGALESEHNRAVARLRTVGSGGSLSIH